MNEIDEYSYFRSVAARRAGVLLWQIYPPILIIFGTLGNSLSIVILSKRKFSRHASSVYLVGLAVADTFILYIGLLRQWVKYMFDTDIRFTSNAACKIHWWLIYSNADVCVWILPAITVERLVSTLCPTKSKIICTPQRAKIILLGILLAALLINAHPLYGFGRLEILTGNNTMVIPCAPLTDSYDYFFGKVWTWIDLCKFSLFPFALLAIGNICITWRVIQSSKRTKVRVGPTGVNTRTATTNRNTSSMSKLLVTLNFAFIICTAPVCIYFIGQPYWIPAEVPRNIQLQDPWWAIVNLMMYLNSTINFILYCLSGSRFREEIRKLFKRKDNSVNPTSIQTSRQTHSMHM